MGISSQEFLQHVIRPTLHQLGTQSANAEQLLLATALHQSGLGQQLQQNHGIGLYAISPELHTEVWDQHIAFDPDLASQIRGMASQHEFPKAPHSELLINLRYATAIAWLVYRHRGVNIPDASDPVTLALCWQKGFLGHPASARELAEFICHYKELLAESPALKHAA